MLKRQITKKQMAQVHARIPDVYEQLQQGRVSRREFLRTATLLGMSVGVASVAAACGAGTISIGESSTTAGTTTSSGESAAAAPSVGGIKRGGTWTSAMQLQGIDHPARLSWIQGGMWSARFVNISPKLAPIISLAPICWITGKQAMMSRRGLSIYARM